MNWLLALSISTCCAAIVSGGDGVCQLEGASSVEEAAEAWFRKGMEGHDSEHSFRSATHCAPSMAKAYNNLGATLGTGNLMGAVRAMNHAIALQPSLPGAPLSRQRLFNSAVPAWHFSMMNDKGRNEAFKLAIERALTANPKAHVLDLGCGAGLLAMMAARAGAAHVHAVDATPLLAEMAQNVIARNGFDRQITVHAKWSLDLSVGNGADLDGPVDVVVSEVVNSGLIGEGMLKSYNDVWQRGLAKPGAVMIPASAKVEAFIIESDEIESHTRIETASGFDMRDFNTFHPADYMQYDLRHTQYRPLTDKFVPFHFDFSKQHSTSSEVISLTFKRSGRAVAVAFWFVLKLDSETELTLSPQNGGSASPHWRQAVQYLGGVADVVAGDVLRMQVSHDLQNIHFRVVDITRP